MEEEVPEVPEVTEGDVVDEPDVTTESLIEEISIDGMCGVY